MDPKFHAYHLDHVVRLHKNIRRLVNYYTDDNVSHFHKTKILPFNAMIPDDACAKMMGPSTFHAFYVGKFDDPKLNKKGLSDKHYKFLVAFVNDCMTDNFAIRSKPSSQQRREQSKRDAERYVNRKNNKKCRTTPSQASSSKDLSSNRAADARRAADYRNREKERAQNKILIFGMEDSKRSSYNVTDQRQRDYLRIRALKLGRGDGQPNSSCCWDVYTCGYIRNKEKKLENAALAQAGKSKHWDGYWPQKAGLSDDRFLKSCPFVDQGISFKFAILDYFYAPAGFLGGYLSEYFVNKVIPFVINTLRVPRFIIPYFQGEGDWVMKLLNDNLPQTKGGPPQVVIGIDDGYLDDSDSGEEFCDSNDTLDDARYYYRIAKITATQNPLYNATNDEWTATRLEGREVNPKCNKNMVCYLHHEYPFLSITRRRIKK